MTTLSPSVPSARGSFPKRLLIIAALSVVVVCMTKLLIQTSFITLIAFQPVMYAAIYLTPMLMVFLLAVNLSWERRGKALRWRMLLPFVAAAVLLTGLFTASALNAQHTRDALVQELGGLLPTLEFVAVTRHGIFTGLVPAHDYACGELAALSRRNATPGRDDPAFVVSTSEATPATVTSLTVTHGGTDVVASIPESRRLALRSTLDCPGNRLGGVGSVTLQPSPPRVP